MNTVSKQEELTRLRKRRELECFSIVNRGKLWYDCLTIEQIHELRKWYFAWLNVTETLTIPVKPEWLKNKLNEEEYFIW